MNSRQRRVYKRKHHDRIIAARVRNALLYGNGNAHDWRKLLAAKLRMHDDRIDAIVYGTSIYSDNQLLQ